MTVAAAKQIGLAAAGGDLFENHRAPRNETEIKRVCRKAGRLSCRRRWSVSKLASPFERHAVRAKGLARSYRFSAPSRPCSRTAGPQKEGFHDRQAFSY